MKKEDEGVALVVNSHHSCEDIWPAFIGQYFSCGWSQVFSRVYILSSSAPKDVLLVSSPHIRLIQYDPKLPYNLQYLSCIKKVSHNTIAIANEDCIPLAPPNIEECFRALAILNEKKNQLSFIKLVKGEEIIRSTAHKSLYEIDPVSNMFFTQQVSFWRRKDLLDVYAMSPTSHIGRKGGIQQEEVASEVCRTQRLRGYLYYNGEPKRGLYHHDCSILPHICTAIVGGKWNTYEYKSEIHAIAQRYSIDLQVRGFYAGI